MAMSRTHEHTLSCLEDRGGKLYCRHETSDTAHPRPKSIAAGSQGRYATMEQGKIVLYDVMQLDYGCETRHRYPTRLSVYSAGLDPSEFPTKAGIESDGRWYIVVAHPVHGRRHLSIDKRDVLYDEGTTIRAALPEKSIPDAERSRRWRYIHEKVEQRGGHTRELMVTRGRVTKKIMDGFHEFARLALAGKSEDEVYDAVIEKMGADNGNEFFRLTRFHWSRPVGPKDLFALTSFAAKTNVPVAFHGDVPQIDWCNP